MSRTRDRHLAQAVLLRRLAKDQQSQLDSISRMAKAHERAAADLERKAAPKRTIAAQAVSQAQGLIEGGMTEPKALALVSERLMIPHGHIYEIWNRAKIENAKLKRWMRNRDIMRLARLGLTNGEIADSVGLHRNTVSRILQRELKNGHSWRLSKPD